MQIQFLVVSFVDEIDGTIRKAILSADRIDRIVEYKNFQNAEKPKVLEQVKSVLFFKTKDKQFREDFRYITQSIDDIIGAK